MNLRELELFGTLMRVSTTIETARVLGVSQPAVSGQLKRLERRLGLSLFHRTGNRLEPTQEAVELFELAQPIFSTHARIRSRLSQLRDLAERPVTLSATPALIEHFLGPVLRRAGYHGWKRRIVIHSHAPEDDLRNRRADIGLQMAIPARAEFQAHPVGRADLVAILQPDHPLTARARLGCTDLAAQPLVCYDPEWSPMGAAIRAAFEAQRLVYAPACLVPYCVNVCSMVRACGGVGIVDSMTAQAQAGPAQSGRGLVARPITDLPPVSIIAFHRRHEPMRALVQDLLSALLAPDAAQ